MNLIFFSRRQGQARHLDLMHPVTMGVVGVLALGLLAATFTLGMRLGARGLDTRAQRIEVASLRQKVRHSPRCPGQAPDADGKYQQP